MLTGYPPVVQSQTTVRTSTMHLQRNFVWSLDLSERELKVIVKVLKDEELDDDEQSLSEKLGETLAENAVRLDRVSTGRRRRK